MNRVEDGGDEKTGVLEILMTTGLWLDERQL